MMTQTKPPTWFWVVSVLALLWNLMGVGSYLGNAFLSEEALAAMPEAEQQIRANTPAWATAAFALATWGGFLGCVMLLLRKSWATTFFYISLIAVLVQDYFGFVEADLVERHGTFPAILAVAVIIIALLLIRFSQKAKKNGWIN